MTSPRSCCSNFILAVDRSSSFTPRRAELAKPPIREADETNNNARHQERKDTDDDEESNTDDGFEFDDDSDTGDSPEYESGLIFDSDDDVVAANDEGMEETADRNSSYNSDLTNVTVTKDADDCFTVQVDDAGPPVR
jgi:hypothetical protein